MTDLANLKSICTKMRRQILEMTTAAGSGHVTSSLSAVELMSCLFLAGFFKADFDQPKIKTNDRLIFSKGHASPLFYSLFAAKGLISAEKLMTFRQFDSNLEGHPTPRFEFTEATTGSLGQGLGIAAGIAIAAKMDQLNYKTWVLLGDSELAEGSIWEAAASASFYELNNLIGIVDMNRLGQRGQAQLGWKTQILFDRFISFGWQVLIIEDGHSLEQVLAVFDQAVIFTQTQKRPIMIIAKTIKGKGVSFLEDKDGWHGKALNQEQLEQALSELV